MDSQRVSPRPATVGKEVSAAPEKSPDLTPPTQRERERDRENVKTLRLLLEYDGVKREENVWNG